MIKREFNPDFVKEITSRVPKNCETVKPYLVMQLLKAIDLLFIDPPMQKNSKEHSLYIDHIKGAAYKMGRINHNYAYAFLNLLKNSLTKSWGLGHSQYDFPIMNIEDLINQIDTIPILPKGIPEKVIKLAKQNDISDKKIGAKYYALLHWIRIEIGKELPIEKTANDTWPKKKMIILFKAKYPNISSEQVYKEFKSIDILKKPAIARSFGSGYKNITIKASNNDSDIIIALKDYPN